MNAQDLMSTKLIVVPPAMPVAAVAGLLSARGVSGAPVVDAEGMALGVVTEGDLIRRLADESPGPLDWFLDQFKDPSRLAGRFVKAHGATARDVMSTDLVTADKDTSAEDIARLMQAHRIKRVLVVHHGKLVGVVSRADLLRALLPPKGAERSASDADDDAIMRAVLAAMHEQPWIDTFWTFASVRDGVVTFYGYTRSDLVREGLRAVAQEIPGVKRVEDHTEPMPLILRATL